MKLINADDMVKSLMDMTFYDAEGHTIHDYEDRLAIVKSFVDPVPTVDAEPVIRCMDCKFWSGEYHSCTHHDVGFDWDDADYCSMAERKSE